MEFVNDKAGAQARYGKEQIYQDVFAKAEEMISAPAFTSAKLLYGGFPMMGEDALRGQMESIGAVKARLRRRISFPPRTTRIVVICDAT